MTPDAVQLLREACNIAALSSTDPHTQNGAILIAKNGARVAAANQLPPIELRPERMIRPAKYTYIEHAERHVIYRAAREGVATQGATLYCPWFACADCARAIILAGIAEVVGLAHPPAHGIWKETCERGDEMMREAGVVYRRLEEQLGVLVLRDGVYVEV